MKVFVFMILSCALLNTSSALYMTNKDPNINEILGRYSFPKGPIMEQNFEEELEKLGENKAGEGFFHMSSQSS